MRLTVKRLGRIEQADLDIRPLTVLIGPNGTNKTWVAYTLYDAMRFISWGSAPEAVFTEPQLEGDRDDLMQRLERGLEPLLGALSREPAPDRVIASVQVDTFWEGMGGKLDYSATGERLCQVLRLPPGSLPEVYTRLEVTREELVTTVARIELILERSLNQLTLRAIRSPAPAEKEPLSLEATIAGPWTRQAMLRFAVSQLSKVLGYVVAFPAERNGLVELPDMVPWLGRIRLPIPVLDFARFMATGRHMAIRNGVNARFLELLNTLVGGSIEYQQGEYGRELMFKVDQKTVLPMESASSLSRAVAGLSIYLRHFLHPDDVIIIDELEMNAHPEAQLGLTELMAMLVNQGVRVLFTTHSPYVVDHLSNLMAASQVPVDRQDRLAQKFTLKTREAFITSDKVSVYDFEEKSPGGPVEVRDVLDRQEGLIDWSTFSRQSNRVSSLYNDVLLAMPSGDSGRDE